MKFIKRIAGAVLAVGMTLSLAGCSGGTPGNIGETTFANGDKIAEIEIEDYGVIKAKLFPDIAPVGVENFEQLAAQGYYNGLKIHRVVPDCCIQGGSLNGDGTGGTSAINKGQPFNVEISENARNFYGALCYVSSDDGTNLSQFYIVNSKKTVDMTQYDAAKMREKADEIAAKLAELAEDDPSKDTLTAQQTYYTNMADMFEKADENVIAKYAETGGYPFWDGQYTVFGQVFEGFDVIDKISAVKRITNNTGEVSRPVDDIIIASVKITEYVAPEPEPEQSSSKKKK